MWAPLILQSTMMTAFALLLLVLPVKSIALSPAWLVAKAINPLGHVPQSVFVTLEVNEGSCQSDAWEWMRALGGNVQAYADDQIHDLAARFNVSSEIVHFRTVVQQVVSATTEFQDIQQEQMRMGLTTTGLLDIHEHIEQALMDLFSELQAEFPAPDKSLGHDERAKQMSKMMARARETIVKVGVEHGISEESLNHHLNRLCPHIESLIILTGDLAEQHPELLGALLLWGSLALIPEMFLLRPFLGLFGFGPYGPVKGTLAAWAQRVFFGAAVPKGAWFAYLQHAAMKYGPWWKIVVEWVRGLLGIAGSLFATCKIVRG